MLYRCRTLLPMDGSAPVANAAVVVRGDTIAAAGRWVDLRREFGGEPVADLGEQIVLPGLINAHCHLDYSMMRGAIASSDSFSGWVGRINALKRELTEADYLRAIAEGFGEARRHGTTTVFNVESFPALLPLMPGPPLLRTWWFFEMIDLRAAVDPAKLLDDARRFFAAHPDWLGGCGLSPHAPYTASAGLYRATRRLGTPWTTHLCESRDEDAMFREARGPLHDFLSTLGRPMDDCGAGRSAVETLVAADALGPECLAVHMNALAERDFGLLARGGPLHGLNVVHCPQSHRYFRHPPFPAARLLREGGVNLCLGTDSLASSPSLDLFAEMRAFRADTAAAGLPFTAAQTLETITTNPARALGLSNRLGCVRSHAWADLIALPGCADDADLVYETVLAHDGPVEWMLVAGRPSA